MEDSIKAEKKLSLPIASKRPIPLNPNSRNQFRSQIQYLHNNNRPVMTYFGTTKETTQYPSITDNGRKSSSVMAISPQGSKQIHFQSASSMQPIPTLKKKDSFDGK